MMRENGPKQQSTKYNTNHIEYELSTSDIDTYVTDSINHLMNLMLIHLQYLHS